MIEDRKTASINLAKNTMILTIGMICTQGLGFLLLPLYTSVLDTNEYGVYDLLITYGMLLFPIVGGQFEQGLFRFMLDAQNDEERISELFSTVFVIDILHVVLYVIFGGIISVFYEIDYLPFLLIYVCMQVFYTLMQQFVRGLGKSSVYAIANFLSAGLTIILNVFFLVVVRMRLTGMFFSVTISYMVSIMYMCVCVQPWKYFNIEKIDKKTLHSIRKYSLPLIPNNLSWWVVNVSDRTIITYFLGLSFNGIYTVANKFSNVFITIYNVFNVSWTETVSLYYENEDRDVFLSDMITVMYRLFSSMCFGIVGFMPFIFPILVNSKYQKGYNQVIILMYAMLLRVVVGLYSCIYVAMKDSGKIAVTSAMAAVINILVNVMLIGKLGIYAASISTFTAFGVMAVVRYLDINKTMNIRIEKKTLLSSGIIAGIMLIGYYRKNKYVNVILLMIAVTYAVYMNKDLIKKVIQYIYEKMLFNSGNKSG
ncbi:lipopolysaccharide biosynthesis protein [Blautia sp. MSJ-9]|uniref:lipopolysaccharide biosynthesis protein n=1 Tax=Blautia sp. MSJ-9 TaxID=2841511 RepID=UPI001C116BB8|nr:oligosaccharide flippase family protein [Blautia sp. MSJ-9]MBU5681119.1 oligosaccharide flippase family protein [Blautia sp. MSJ-9]